jgi:endogenous inhibitor of DNA gyrase (YacG/DUF329 family)
MSVQEPTFRCPQCGDPTERLFEGYCEPCCEDNQRALDLHNAEYDAWQAKSKVERGHAIKEAMRRE